MIFGKYECFSLEVGSFALDGGAMFGIVPKVLWEKKISADDQNRIRLKSRSLLIKGKTRNILIDTGLGSKLPSKIKKLYSVDDNSVKIERSLSKHGLSLSDITDVVLTHLHFDHAGGSTLIKNGKVVPTFPTARHYVQKDQWAAAINPSLRDKASYRREDFIPLMESNLLELVDGPTELFQGIELMVTNGHTPGQQHPLIKGKDSSLFYCADLIPTSAHLPILWHMAFDHLSSTIIKEKEKIFIRALKENWVLFFEHDPNFPAARIKTDNNKLKIDEVVWI
ncbi:MAG: MBL fold metallo-hydrolase [Desulfobacterales bacterium]|nr:MBL fold metallo-hydrolase [Desulfobacterales bacterium]